MTEPVKVDRIDRAILRELQANGRLKNQELSERVHLSASACLARVKRLEEAGVIEGYGARVRPSRMGPCVVIVAHVTLARHDAKTAARFEAVIRDTPEAIAALSVSGTYDYHVHFVVPDMQAWTGLTKELTEREDLGIGTIVTTVLLRDVKPWRGVPI